MPPHPITVSQLESHLWEAANILRGPVDAADFKTYVFPLLFLKRICDAHDEKYGAAIAAAGEFYKPLIWRPAKWMSAVRSSSVRTTLGSGVVQHRLTWLILLMMMTASLNLDATTMMQTSRVKEERPARDQSPDHSDDITKLREAAARGDVRAQFSLGLLYATGEGVTQDLVQAAQWYQRAAAHDDARAQYQLGLLYLSGTGVPPNEATAVRWFKAAADHDHPEAEYAMGFAYEIGRGIQKNATLSYEWYRKAAEQGLAQAEYRLGAAYHRAKGVEQDFDAAIRWYGKAAAQGEPDAQYELGVMFRNGEGVAPNDEEAAKWYGKAAEQGHSAAQFALALSLKDGRGVPKNYVEAHMWMSVIVGRSSDVMLKTTCASAREALEMLMTAAEREEAQKRTRWWLESYDRRTS